MLYYSKQTKQRHQLIWSAGVFKAAYYVTPLAGSWRFVNPCNFRHAVRFLTGLSNGWSWMNRKEYTNTNSLLVLFWALVTFYSQYRGNLHKILNKTVHGHRQITVHIYIPQAILVHFTMNLKILLCRGSETLIYILYFHFVK